MAKKESLSLAEKITRMEQYITNDLGRRVAKNPTNAKVVAELDLYLGPRLDARGGRLGTLYDQRDQLRTGCPQARIFWLKEEINLVSRQLAVALPKWELQGRVQFLTAKKASLAGELQQLYDAIKAERDAPLMKAKLEQLQQTLTTRPALTATSLPLNMTGPERSGKRKTSKPRRYIPKADDLKTTRPSTMKSQLKSDHKKSRKRQREIAA